MNSHLRPISSRRRSHRCFIRVEAMESRALLTSGVVQGAIYTVQQAQLDGKNQIADEISTLKSNIVAIVMASNDSIYGLNSDILTQKQDELANPANKTADNATIKTDQQNIKLAIRDEKFAIGQQNALIGSLQHLQKQYNSQLNGNIKNLNKGKQDPTTISDLLSNESSSLTTQVMTIDAKGNNEAAIIQSILANFNPGTPTPTPITPQPQFQLTGSITGTHTQGGVTTPTTNLSLATTTFSDNQNTQSLIIQLIAQSLLKQYTVPTTVTLSNMATQGNNMTGSYTGTSPSSSDSGTFSVTGSALDPNFFKHQVFNGKVSGRVADDGSNSPGDPSQTQGNASLAGDVQITVDHTSDSVFMPGGTVTVNFNNIVQTPSAALRQSGSISNGILDDYSGNYSGSAQVNSFENPITLTLSGATDITVTIQLNGSAPGDGTFTFKANMADTGNGSLSFQ